MRAAMTMAVLLAAATLAACDATDEGGGGEGPLAVYLSAPLSGPAAGDGNAIAMGAQRALRDAGGKAAGREVELIVLDIARGAESWTPAAAGENARRAAEDADTIAYIGELESGATRTSLPILNQAGIPQIAPGSPAVDLTRPVPAVEDSPEIYQPGGDPTLIRVVPDLEAQRRAKVQLPPALLGYGYEAMMLLMDALERAEDPTSRASVREALIATTNRDSLLGRYSITADGDTTLDPRTLRP